MSVINPTGSLYLDILYYFLILFFGPGFLWNLILFRPKRNKLHDAYRNSGVETTGLAVHCKVIIRRGGLTRIEHGRHYEMRYAYRAPEEMNTVYIKDYVRVQKQILNQRLFTVVILPGQPSSGVPKFKIPSAPLHPIKLVLLYIMALSLFGFCTWVFTLLFALGITNHCTKLGDTYYCSVAALDGLLGLLAVTLIGWGMAYGLHRHLWSEVPGRVWKTVQRTTLNDPRSALVGVHRTNAYDINRIDSEPIPMADAVAILDESATNNYNNDGNGDQPTNAPLATAYAVNESLQPAPESEMVENHDDHEQTKSPEARVLEVV